MFQVVRRRELGELGWWRLETGDWRLEIGSGRLTDFGVGKFPVPLAIIRGIRKSPRWNVIVEIPIFLICRSVGVQPLLKRSHQRLATFSNITKC